MDKRQKSFFETSQAYFETLAQAGAEYFKEYLAFIRHYAPAGSRLLDAGCGTGQSTDLLARAGFIATGVDGTERFIAEARKAFPDGCYELADLEQLPFANQSFETVASYNTLEHVTDVPKVLSELLRVTKNGGLLLIHSPNLLSIKHISDAFLKRAGRTFEGVKTRPQLLRLLLRNISWVLKRTISSRADFKYRQPDYQYDFPDNDATVYLNPLDLKHCLEGLGTKIISYQEVKHLPGASVPKMVASRFLADHMGIIRIVARKGARYERQ